MNSTISVLIADDHPIFRKGLCEVIENAASLRLVGQAANGEDALRWAVELQPDVAILDINMPKLSGLQVARTLIERHLATKLVLKESAVEDLLSAVQAVVAGRTFISPTIAALLMKRRKLGEELRREKPGLDMLTPSERRILRLIAEDRTTKEIADALGVSPRTVETHRQNMSHKLHLSGSHSLLKFAFDNKANL